MTVNNYLFIAEAATRGPHGLLVPSLCTTRRDRPGRQSVKCRKQNLLSNIKTHNSSHLLGDVMKLKSDGLYFVL